ncbi:MAG: alpha/beta fold hydrolase [Pseudomonadota bacterium]
MEEWVKLPDFGNLAMSTDGLHIAATTRIDGDAYMVVMNIEDPAKPQVIYRMKPPLRESIAGIEWISSDRLLYTTTRQLGTLAAPIGSGNVYAINKDGKRGSRLVGPGISASFFGLNGIVSKLPEDPYDIVVSTQGFGRGAVFERINTVTGKRTIVATSPFDNGGMAADENGAARFAVGNDDSTNEAKYAYRQSADSDWEIFDSPFDGSVWPVGFNGEEETALMTTNDENNFGVIQMDLVTKKYEQLIRHDRVPINSILMGTDEETVVGVEFLPGLPEIQYLPGDTKHHRLWKRLHLSFPDQHIRIGDVTDDGLTALVTVISDKQPPRYFLLDTEAFTARYLFDSRPAINAEEMRPRESFWIEARDGIEFQLYVTKPEGEGPFPTVMVIHGGPHGPRDTWSYDLEAQMLASKGYAVVQPNYRGSGGFGYQFERSGYRRWYLEMQDDVTDATLWAIDQGIADPERTCIYGGSYGGFATMAGVTKEPDLYACGFAFVGVYDLELMLTRGDIPDFESGRTFLTQALGRDKDDLKARSPANHVANIKADLYVAHGKADQRVPVVQYYNLLEKLDQANIPYESLLVSREGHGFYKLENRVKYYNELLNFLDNSIGVNGKGKAGRWSEQQQLP